MPLCKVTRVLCAGSRTEIGLDYNPTRSYDGIIYGVVAKYLIMDL